METRRMCPQCRAFITTRDRVCPYCNEPVARPAARTPGPTLGGLIPHARFNTTVILLVNFGLYIATALYNMRVSGAQGALNIDSRVLYIFGAKVGLGYMQGQWWRLVTAGFLHGGLFHILMNSWVLFDLGAQVDELYGAARMWVIYFCSSVAGFFLSAWAAPNPSIGASAALCGLIGAMIALGLRDRGPTGKAIRSVYIRWAVYLLLFSFLPGIDIWAHVGGGLAGFALGYVAGTPRGEAAPAERLWRAAAWLCVLLTVVSFLKLYLWYTHTPA